MTFLLLILALLNDSGSRFTSFEKRLPESFQGATITGTVVDARTMQPLRGAIVIAARVPVNKPDAPPNIGFRTGEDGKFVLRGVAPGIVNFSVVKAGYTQGPFTSVRPARDGDQIDDVVLTVPPGASISGRILDESGHPVAGTQVTVRMAKPAPGTTPAQSDRGATTSNDDGQYWLGGLAAGEYLLSVGSLNDAAEFITDGELLVADFRPPADRLGAQSRNITLAVGEDRVDLDLKVRFPITITAPKRPSDGTATVQGRVVDSSGVAVPHAPVWLRQEGKEMGVMITRSDAAGRFVLRQVPAGSFRLATVRFGLSVEGVGEAGPQMNLSITPGSLTENIVLTTRRGGTISGTLTDEFGDPSLASVIVVSPLIRPDFSPDNISISSRPDGSQIVGRRAGVDVRGRFRIAGLPPGDYVLSIAAGDSTTAKTETHFTDPSGQDRLFTSGSLFYPGVPTISQATKVTVTDGSEATGVDMTVRPTSKTQIVVTVSASRPTNDIQLQQIQLDPVLPLHERTIRMTEPSVTLEAWPGRYRLLASADLANNPENIVRLWALADVDTDPSIPATVAIHLEPAANISGRVVFEGTEPNRQGVGARLVPVAAQPQLLAFRTASASGSSIFEAATGLFSIEGILPGQYVIQAGTERTPWMLKAATIAGRDVLDEPFELQPGDDLRNVRLTVTDRVTELSGKVTDASSRPVIAEWVLVFAVDKKHWWSGSRWIRQRQPDATGVYTIRGLPPGSYVVTLVQDPAVLADPAKLPGLAASGTRITLGEGERRVLDLKASRR
jgi:Carboxypeptidase regulatory-like domain